MNDQTTPASHKCNDELARERTLHLQRQREEDRAEVASAMTKTTEVLTRLDAKTDKIIETQIAHGEKIAALCAKDEALRQVSKDAATREIVAMSVNKSPIADLHPVLKAIIYAAIAALLGAGGYTVNGLQQPETKAPTEASR
mgnify:FL=1